MSDRCRACASASLYEVLDLGVMPLAGDFKPLGQPSVLNPLAIDGCAECGVLQVRETVDHSVIFGENYSYMSSTVPGLVRHFEDYAKAAAAATRGKRRRRVFEVGCNDGVFLEPLQRAGCEVVGIDSSKNVADMAKARGLDVHVGVFGRAKALELQSEYGQFEVVTCSNVMAHNTNVGDFVEGVDVLLARNGEFWVEVHSAYRLYYGLQWDCFYHEHCFYWTIHSLETCLRRYHFYLRRYETTEMHGGALRAVFSRRAGRARIHEKRLGRPEWETFKSRCLRSRSIIRECVERLPIRYAYGAAGRAVTLINWTGIAQFLEFVVDGSPLRFDRVIPNTRLSIISEDAFFKREDVGEWCFVTAHNYLDGIRAKVESRFPNMGIRFVTPLPEFAVR